VSEALLGAKLNYTEVEKIAYAILTSSRKLKHYFQAHKITVSTSQPLGDILRNKEASGRIGKSHIGHLQIAGTGRLHGRLADFMADWAPSAQSIPQPVIKFGQYS
jgi:hypothetical protein